MEKERNYEYTSNWGLALLNYLNLRPTFDEKRFIVTHWSRFYQNFDNDPLKTTINIYSDLAILKSCERDIETREFRMNRFRILKKIREAEVKEKYESGYLDEILLEQNNLF